MRPCEAPPSASRARPHAQATPTRNRAPGQGRSNMPAETADPVRKEALHASDHPFGNHGLQKRSHGTTRTSPGKSVSIRFNVLQRRSKPEKLIRPITPPFCRVPDALLSAFPCAHPRPNAIRFACIPLRPKSCGTAEPPAISANSKAPICIRTTHNVRRNRGLMVEYKP